MPPRAGGIALMCRRRHRRFLSPPRMARCRHAEPVLGGVLAGIEPHPHARAVLLPALPPAGSPSHAYLFHGPSGTGKRTVARAFAAALLAEGAQRPQTVLARVQRGAHPDLTWVTPSGASEVLVSDIDEPVVAAAAHTPFESSRRVFVIEAAGSMNDQAANRLLKTLEEPPPFAHLILLAEHREDVLPTIASRCQQVRFDPLSDELLAERLRGATVRRASSPSMPPPALAWRRATVSSPSCWQASVASRCASAPSSSCARRCKTVSDSDAGWRCWRRPRRPARWPAAAVSERLHEQARVLARQGAAQVRARRRRCRASR